MGICCSSEVKPPVNLTPPAFFASINELKLKKGFQYNDIALLDWEAPQALLGHIKNNKRAIESELGPKLLHLDKLVNSYIVSLRTNAQDSTGLTQSLSQNVLIKKYEEELKKVRDHLPVFSEAQSTLPSRLLTVLLFLNLAIKGTGFTSKEKVLQQFNYKQFEVYFLCAYFLRLSDNYLDMTDVSYEEKLEFCHEVEKKLSGALDRKSVV